MSEKLNGTVTSGVCERENGVELGFWWFDDENSELNLQTVKGT